ncbi:osmoprotectant transport system substrate-binding protein [Caldalkalibacillus uzonensis]|uniref:Osmoprotectant transport system substrate-binding protein n=1 Tax=Caldalkalibacillus uzonensis TaxID=353224 RepID=A0ABU0CLW3_9BACI|nr:glycine betaine ABC transporter substrate-binding protein [Caldalkalibacillus uzonensis]MDQ0337400.1 osmoprotectant transport system substrate-binding protein [Caldalkalibacillus uzonensis]
MKKWKGIFWLCLVVVSLLLLSACGSSDSNASGDQGGSNDATPQASDDGGSKGRVVVGGKDFTEQQILSKITSIYLKEKGYDVEEVGSMGSAVVRSALENGQIDVYWEYTGTALVIYLEQEAESDPELAYNIVKETDEANGLVWMDKADFNNTYAILMRRDRAEELGIQTISELAAFVNEQPNELTFATNAEFSSREDGLPGLQAAYGFEFPSSKVIRMDSGLLYNALRDNQVDVSVGFATDGRIKGFDLVVLEDDQLFFPAYNAVPVIRQAVLEENEELAELLNTLADHLDTETMVELNYTVDVEHKDVTEVAREWLKSAGLID